MNIFKRIAALEERMEKLESRVSELEFRTKGHSLEFGIVNFREYVSRTSRDIAKIPNLENRIAALEEKSKKLTPAENWARLALKNKTTPL